ncbi:zinc-ribbon domain-containing protein [Dermatophilus congolensis]|uniref:zinc-ribbon domain-containing protein n=1 Tax=Dermatophilus congolensis TaxID=1863 RepID=UPI001AAE54F5|nr:zinc-ribbon domain-containing protein [Dermatophilus congolensis]MBO3146338.1 zinc-ribbon domain-containing protein [Dermatophilus congolensis]MBO3148619.1 zinc-ribbon domain-containing protein [Dermatophilus congolensis]MBO3157574.1 zinc-ribbon domain-containing protein [Dermatophilus congolensis]MBO3159854.1 zinc-ribbon domain-containing protein [Dermatophilus congolensis]MBO3166593.1 zinc-ribbon domain-containing protein [Dermatophilus congolensis]
MKLPPPRRPLSTALPELYARLDRQANQNEGINIELLGTGTCIQVWWKGTCGHSWKSSLPAKVQHGMNPHGVCPQCEPRLRGTKTARSYLVDTHPHIAEDLHPTRNKDIDPSTIPTQSNQKLWWQCLKGHSWLAKVQDRTKRGNGCPICYEQDRTNRGGVNLLDADPATAMMWDTEANHGKTPADVLAGSSKVPAQWRCPTCGYQWESTIWRQRQRQKCPSCHQIPTPSEHTILPGSVAEQRIDLVADLVPEYEGLNLGLISPHSTQTAWWQCPREHRQRLSVADRARQHSCPQCQEQDDRRAANAATAQAQAEQKRRKQSLAARLPHLAQELDPDLNNGITAWEIPALSSRAVWWRCPNGHQWEQSVIDRAGLGSECPICTERFPRACGV